MQIDEELVRGCQRYLDTLKERSAIVEQQKAELRRAEEQRAARREHWRKLLYGENASCFTIIV